MIGPLTTLIAYLLGSIPFGYLIVRWQRGIDVRSTGSGSIGATNVMRNLGVVGFVATFLLDAGKGLLAVVLAARMTGNDPTVVAAAAFAAVLGHCFPFWLRFRGGKGVATGFGVFLAISPWAALAAFGVFAILLAISRYVSVSSIVAAFSFPIFAWFLVTGSRPPFFFVAGAIVSLLIIVKHHQNIRRLIAGTETRFGAHKPA